MVEKKIGEKVVRVVLGDITDIEVEAFVFDITEDAKLGSGYGGAITLRGGPEVQKELDAIGACPSGEAIVTGAGNMKAKTIIHLNGPKFHEPGTEAILRRAVKAALQLAEEKAVTQLAFPPVGTGMYQVPLDLCARVLDEEISGHFAGETTLKEVLLVALDTREYEPLRAQIGTGG